MCLIVTNVIGQYWALKNWLRFFPNWNALGVDAVDRNEHNFSGTTCTSNHQKKKANLLQPSFPP